MEDEDSQIIVSNGRNGDWFTFNDGSEGFINPSPQNDFYMSDVGAPRAGSTKAVYVQGGNFTGWGAGVAFNFALDGGAPVAYDVSTAGGAQFWAKADNPLVVTIALPNVDTDAQGGRCEASGQGDNACYSHFSKQLSLTAQWTEHTVRWSELEQPDFGRRVPTFEATQVYSMNFSIAIDQPFGVWIDDVAFVR